MAALTSKRYDVLRVREFQRKDAKPSRLDFYTDEPYVKLFASAPRWRIAARDAMQPRRRSLALPGGSSRRGQGLARLDLVGDL